MPRALSAAASRLGALGRDQRGVSTTEFLVLLVFIAVAGTVAVRALGSAILDIIGV